MDEPTDPPKRTHCLHHQGYGVSTGDTMRWSEICCHCGESVDMVSYREVVPGHGPHASVTRVVTSVSRPAKSEFCTPAPLPERATNAIVIGGQGVKIIGGQVSS